MKHFKSFSKNFYNQVSRSVRRSHKNIIIHNTGVVSDGDKAITISKNFATIMKNASCDFVVDSHNCEQLLSDNYSAWSTGGNLYNDYLITGGAKQYRKVLDIDSFNIEMCNCFNKLDILTLENTIYLVKYLKKKYNIKNKNIYRHFDVTGKYCPRLMSNTPYGNYNENWVLFKKCVKTFMTTKITIEKDGRVYKQPKGQKKKCIGIFKLQ